MNRWWFAVSLWALGVVATRAAAQPATAPAATAPATTTGPASSGELITLNLPESVELKTLADYVSKRLDLNIMYSEEVGAQRVAVRTPAKLPKESLLGLLQSAVQIKGFALVDGDAPGLKKIIPVTNLGPNARAPDGAMAGGEATAVTQVFHLEHVDPAAVDPIVKIFLTQPGGNSVALTQQRVLVVTDYATNVRRIGALVEQIDRPKPAAAVEFVKLEHADASLLAPHLSQLLNSKMNAQGGPIPGAANVEVSFDARTNQMAVVGPADRIPEVVTLIRRLDVPMPVETRAYRFEHVSPDRVDKMIKQLVDPRMPSRVYQSAVDPAKEGHLLVAIATADIHKQIEAIKRDIDVAAAKEDSPIRFYRLSNTTAADVLSTLRGIIGEQETWAGTTAPGDAYQKRRANPGRSNPLLNGGTQPGAAGAYGQGLGMIRPATSQPTNIGGAPHVDPLNRDVESKAQPPAGFQTDDARVTADPNTNTIIVIAPPQVQRTYEELVRHLDKRRPQVLIECTLVTVDTSNDFTLGVEILGKGSFDETDILAFSRFGLSEIGTAKHLRIIPGTGFNGTVITSDVADIVIQSLAKNTRSRVVSAPRILVNDNATGTLTSIAEAPYVSINTAVGTIATTSFAGYAQAGTEVTVTPHISDANYLQLEYTVALNNFTGQGSNGIPPPRQTDAVDSTVTIPDGSTIIVGGLNRQNFSKTVNAVPFLGEMPILEYLFSSRSDNKEQGTLFVFLRPTILRDDQFADLKYLSEKEVGAAQLKGDYPESEPLLMQ
jgi:type II secretory pathway component GspD/PulD (secretin)